MDGLEYVVRPYQSPNAHGAIIIPSTPSASRERATLTWGAKATMPTPTSGISFNVVCCQEQLDEQTRETEQVQVPITVSDVQDGYYTVERPKTLSLKKKEKNNCGDDWDQLSTTAQEINADLAAFAANFHSGTTSVGGNGGTCNTKWNLKNK